MPRHLLADIRAAQGRFEEALVLLAFAARAMPDNPMVALSQGNALLSLGRQQDALRSFERVIALAPSSGDAWNGKGVTLQQLGKHEEAMACYVRAIALAPGHVFAQFNRANLLQFLDRHQEALTGYDQVLALAPHHAGAHNNRGWSLLNLRRLDEAQEAFAAAIRLDPGHDAGARLNQGFAHLLTGNFADGLPLYENRKRLETPFDIGPTAAPEWTGAEDIAGKTLLVHHDQGLGDAIQFFRYAAQAAGRGAQVLFAAPRPLVHLMASTSHPVTIVDPQNRPHAFDFHIALMSLPLALGLQASTITDAGRQTAADPARVRHWAARLNPFRIGVAWMGKDDMGKNFPPQMLAGIAALDGVQLICLQKDATPPPALGMVRFDDLDDGADAFADSAAIMEQCDLVITPDTALAHLAGALGIPAWVALKYVPDWRWLLDREDTPWWDSLRLFRQEKPGDWTPVFAAMEDQLRTRLQVRQYRAS